MPLSSTRPPRGRASLAVLALSAALALATACQSPAPAAPSPAPAPPTQAPAAPTQAPAKPASPAATQPAPKPTAPAPAVAQPTAAPKPAPQGPADKITFMLDWLPGGNHGAFFYTLDRGLFKQNNVDAEIIRGYGGAQTAEAMSQGKAEFAFADVNSAIVLLSKGAPLKAIGMVNHVNPMGLASLKSTGIRTPKDLEGKTFGVAAGSAANSLWPVFVKANKIDASKVKIATVDPAAHTALLVQKKVDFTSPFYGSSVPRVSMMAKEIGDEAVFMFWRDYGLDTYGGAILTTDQMIKEKPDLVRRVVKAIYQGIDEAVANPSAAVDATIKINPALGQNRAEVGQQWAQTVEMLQKEPSLGTGYGLMTEEKMKRTRDLIFDAYGVKADLPLSRIYTNQFLPGNKN